jgi:ComF family protein
MSVRTILNEAADALFPQRCVACGRFGPALHAACAALMPAASGPRCLHCWAPSEFDLCAPCSEAPPAFDALRARFRVEGDARRAILEAKFRGVTALVPPLAEAAVEAIPLAWHIDTVVPVPLHRKRERQRGYNQAALLAKSVAARLEAPLGLDLLHRVRETPPQAGLNLERRLRNLLGAFEATSPAPRSIILIDDVTTTGATFEAAAQALRAAGAERIFALAIARED